MPLVSWHLGAGGKRWLALLYYLSSFWGQCGPNATTFLIPAEIVPTEARARSHAVAAAGAAAWISQR